MDPFEGVRVSDLVTFIAVQRTSSVTAAARELRVTPSQVSKAIARLERHLEARLLSRSARGVALTPAGQGILPSVTAAIDAMRQLHRGRAAAAEPTEALTVAGPSYLITSVLFAIAGCQPRLQVRGMELPPSQIRANLGENVFDMALAVGAPIALAKSWTSDRVGRVSFVLFAPPEVAKKLKPLPATAAKVKEVPFLTPLASRSQQSPLDDQCPLLRQERRNGHQAQTIGAALELASRTSHVVFGPRIAGRRMLEAGALVEIPVEGWNVAEDLFFLLCSADRVLARVRRAARDALRSLAELG